MMGNNMINTVKNGRNGPEAGQDALCFPVVHRYLLGAYLSNPINVEISFSIAESGFASAISYSQARAA